jgi:hypothetical protein
MLDFIQPVEVKSDTSTSPSQDLFIDTLAALLVPDHETVSPEQEEKLLQVSHKVKDKVQETIPMTPLLLEDEFNEQQIVSIDTIWHPPVLDLTKLTEKEVMNLCIQCLQAPKYVEPDGRIHEYCGKSCAISAGVLPFPEGNRNHLSAQSTANSNDRPSPIQYPARQLKDVLLEMESDRH